MEYFCNVLLTTVAFYLFFYIGAMGAGDVKLLGVCAGYFSGEKVLCFLFFALLFAAVFALCKMYLARNLWDRLCYLGEYVCGMLSAVDAGRRILQRREHIRQAESVWPVPFFAVCCYT